MVCFYTALLSFQVKMLEGNSSQKFNEYFVRYTISHIHQNFLLASILVNMAAASQTKTVQEIADKELE